MPGRPQRRLRPRRVVVVGASLAGAFAAAASAGPDRVVTVLERDVLEDAPRARRGVPQGRQPHILLRRGLLAIETLLPGFEADLRAAGAVPIDTGDLAWLAHSGWAIAGRPQFEILSATRPLVEQLVMRRVRALPGVRVRDGARVTHVRRRSGGPWPWQVELDDGSTEPADLVVDASGRASRVPAWLAAAGVPPAPISTVDAGIGYATREYAIDDGRVAVAGVVLLATPESPAGGAALPVEGGRWLVGAVGAGEHRPPREIGRFEGFLEELRDAALAEIVAAGRPQGEVAVHRQTANRRHHYEQVRDWPAGLLVVGDALCAFNPVYGQGVTVAALEALALRRALRRGLRPGDTRRLMRGFARIVAVPWGIATGQDRLFPGTGTPPSSRLEALTGRWAQTLGRLSTHGDALAADTTARVYHLVGSPWLLFRPGLVVRAAAARVRGYGPPNPRPAIVHDGARAASEPRAAGAPHPGYGGPGGVPRRSRQSGRPCRTP